MGGKAPAAAGMAGYVGFFAVCVMVWLADCIYSSAGDRKRPASDDAKVQPVKKNREVWSPAIGDLVIAPFPHDGEPAYATVLPPPGGKRTKVKYWRPASSSHDPRLETMVSHVPSKLIRKPWDLPKRPTSKTQDEEASFFASDTCIKEGDYVLAMRESGRSQGSWLPATVTKIGSGDEDIGVGRVFCVQSLFGNAQHKQRMVRDQLRPLYEGSALRYGQHNVPIWPLADEVAFNQQLVALKPAYEPLPLPPPVPRNYSGAHFSKPIGKDEDGEEDFRAVSRWQNITLMEQTKGTFDSHGLQLFR